MRLRFTLLADGRSDRAIVPIIEWVLRTISTVTEAGFAVEFTVGEGFESRYSGLAGRIDAALRMFPCDLLFVHRDAETEPIENRVVEIERAAGTVVLERYVPIIPVRMTEAWLLISESAIRMAADNPNGRDSLSLPPLAKLDSLPDPKHVCGELLLKASGKQGRRLKKLKSPSELAWRRVRVAQLIEDFAPLMKLDAFRRFVEATRKACEVLRVEPET